MSVTVRDMSRMNPATKHRMPRWQWLMLAVVAAAAGAIAGGLLAKHHGDGWQWLHWCCKPLTTMLILLLAWRARPAVSEHYRCWICVGILFSCGGDIFLMLPWDLFVPGLVAFLLGHICFLVAFLGDSRFGARPFLMLACASYGAINLLLLWPSIAPPLRMPVIVYVAVLACMAGQAAVRARVFAMQRDAQTASARRAAIGALIFLISDSVLAWNRFHAPIPLADMWVLSTYYLSLWWIARSVQRDGVTTPQWRSAPA